MNREQFQKFADKFLDAAKDLSRRKNADYAGSEDPFRNFRDFGEYGIVVRMSDKFARLRQLCGPNGRKPAVSDEAIEDTLLDLINYCWILAAWREADRGEED